MRHLLTAATIAAVATAACGAIIFGFKFGPVIATISDGRGIHTGDLAGLAIGAAGWATAWATYHNGRPR